MEFNQYHDPAAETQAPEQTRLPTTSSGQLQLTDWAIGVVHDPALARRCAHALEEAGTAPADICIVPGATALQQLQTAQQLERHENVLQRFREAAEDALRQAELVRDELETEARAGRTLLGIHLPDSEQIDSIRNTLEEHQVHHLYLFEPMMISHLLN